jgi:hypothetical protein
MGIHPSPQVLPRYNDLAEIIPPAEIRDATLIARRQQTTKCCPGCVPYIRPVASQDNVADWTFMSFLELLTPSHVTPATASREGLGSSARQ